MDKLIIYKIQDGEKILINVTDTIEIEQIIENYQNTKSRSVGHLCAKCPEQAFYNCYKTQNMNQQFDVITNNGKKIDKFYFIEEGFQYVNDYVIVEIIRKDSDKEFETVRRHGKLDVILKDLEMDIKNNDIEVKKVNIIECSEYVDRFIVTKCKRFTAINELLLEQYNKEQKKQKVKKI